MNLIKQVLKRIKFQENLLKNTNFMNQMSGWGLKAFKQTTKSEISRNKAYLKRLMKGV